METYLMNDNNNNIVTYPDLEICVHKAKVNNQDHFKLAWAQAHNMKYEDVTEEQGKECQYVYYVLLFQI